MDKNTKSRIAAAKQAIVPFVERCKETGHPVSDLQFREVLPGASNTQYYVQVVAPWAEGIPYTSALEFLIGILFETTDYTARYEYFFGFDIFTNKEDMDEVSEQNRIFA